MKRSLHNLAPSSRAPKPALRAGHWEKKLAGFSFISQKIDRL
jgi:hypothetical protein